MTNLREWLRIVEDKQQRDWTRIADLRPEQQRLALDAFAALANGQRGEPEMLGGGGHSNPAITFAPIFRHATEHVGDLTHRMAQRHCERMAYGFEWVQPKVRTVLSRLRDPSDFADEARSGLRLQFKFATERGDFGGSFEAWTRAWERAGIRYADAHAKLPVYNKAQWHAREAAVTLGRQQLAATRSHLHGLQSLLADGDDAWCDAASLVRMGGQGPLGFTGAG